MPRLRSPITGGLSGDIATQAELDAAVAAAQAELDAVAATIGSGGGQDYLASSEPLNPPIGSRLYLTDDTGEPLEVLRIYVNQGGA